MFDAKANRRQLMVGALAGAAALVVNRGGIAFAQDATPAGDTALAAGEANWPMFNLNAASDEQFLTVPGVGDKMLREFNEYKPYTNLAHFVREIGKYVDEQTINGYLDYVFVPVDPANVDADSLLQLPGMDEEKAATIAGGAYASGEELVAALAGVLSAVQAAIAPQYIAGTATDIAEWPMFNLNTATDEELLTVPGVGDRMLDEFREYMPWTTVGQFSQEIGKYVDADVVEGYLDYVFVPVAIDATELETFAQLPGVDADKAQALLDAQPYADVAAFLAKLAELVSAEQAAVAPAYLAE